MCYTPALLEQLPHLCRRFEPPVDVVADLPRALEREGEVGHRPGPRLEPQQREPQAFEGRHGLRQARPRVAARPQRLRRR